MRAGLVVGSVTTSEYLVLYVYEVFGGFTHDGRMRMWWTHAEFCQSLYVYTTTSYRHLSLPIFKAI
ncbi:hypothetical protein BDP81DRAFT_431030 [Colletotrichum phormii]|uniref:Uncharacterized protein n=1 Tax=Colletotrichum phormii TaxID=359342 RepID=A0AAI9ZNE6_9PEZI|nr:uncharacterized protein BDP81DRAFT_431030 [Colletotrichum phormii]KAK1635217.1 hypothetical protein BDP81DRAFT_431030 [Colletotrichum phormii]